MSDTKRKIVRYKKKNNPHSDIDSYGFGKYEEVIVDDTQCKYQKKRTGRKMKPYAKDMQEKYDVATYMVESPGRDRKLKIRNANRTIKKGERMRLKQELRKQLEELDNGE